jgi:hypothetical protein
LKDQLNKAPFEDCASHLEKPIIKLDCHISFAGIEVKEVELESRIKSYWLSAELAVTTIVPVCT